MAYDQDYALPRTGAPTREEERVSSRTMFGHVMALVAVTCAFAALGAYIGRDLKPGVGFGSFVGALGCTFAIRYAIARSERLAITLLFGMGLLLGLFIGPLVNEYAKAEPGVVYQAAGATALFVGGLGAYGYATSRDFSNWARRLFWSLLALIGFGLVTLCSASRCSASTRSSTSTGSSARATCARRRRSRRGSSSTSSTCSCSCSNCSAAGGTRACG